MRNRDANLDLLRATAIIMVLVYHVTQRWPVPLPRLYSITRYGEYGVDLFFVLSGWLIGGLLWREQAQFGNVQIGRFLCRRALRTIPPYLAALAISYSGVFIVRHEPFNWGYLLFLQNYYERLPYFLVSWSLCVEEHFYLLMPVLALSIIGTSPRSHILLLLAALLPALCRAFTWDSSQSHAFGYYYTATHLRYEGLLLGVWGAFLHQRLPGYWTRFQRMAPMALIPTVLGVVAADYLPGRLRYALFYFAVAVMFLLLLVSVVDRKPVLVSGKWIVFWLASTSYSVYLIHAVALDMAFRVTARISSFAMLQLLAVVMLIALSGGVFHRLVEMPSLAMRHRLIPGRTRERSPLLDTVASNGD